MEDSTYSIGFKLISDLYGMRYIQHDIPLETYSIALFDIVLYYRTCYVTAIDCSAIGIERKMEKEKYIAPEMEIVEFDNEDVITTSNQTDLF